MSPSFLASRRRRPAPFLIFMLAIASTLLAVDVTAKAKEAETGWPRILEASRGHSVVVYEPRVTSFQGRELKCNAAASIQPPDDAEPTFGAIWFTAELEADSDGKAVRIEQLEVTSVKFPENTPQLEENIAAIVERELPKSDRPWPLDRIYAGLEAEKNERATAAKIRNDAPEILVSTSPAVLLAYQGEPQIQPVSNSELSLVVNTAHLVVYDGGGKNYYLAHGSYWYQAREVMGPWEAIANPPSNVLAMKPSDSVEGVGDGPRLDSAPEVITSTKPAELIVFDGKPQFETVEETDLLYVTNSDKDVLKDLDSQKYYVLLSGRWFSSATLNGHWSFVPSDKLPEDFANIPRGSEIAHLRASVAGTPEAEEAVLSARVPIIEAVDRKEKAPVQVKYDGDPEFRRLKETNIAYAVNTSSSVFRQEDRYYLCEDAVWYVSDSPEGPWAVSNERPEGLEELPAENPHYHTKYVQIYDSTPDVVYVGYTPGYFGCYPYHGSVIYGTGWYYDPWYGHAYYPYPATWGFGISYWGGWGFGFYASFGWGYGGYYGYPGYYHGYPAYCGGYYGPGGYYPVYNNTYNTYATERNRTTVTDRQWSGSSSTKTNAYRKSAGEPVGKSTALRSGRGTGTETSTTSTRVRSSTNRVRSAEQSLTRRSSGSRERSTLSDRGTRSMRGSPRGSSTRERITRGLERSGGGASRSRGDVTRGRPQVNGRGWGDARVMRGDGRTGRSAGRSEYRGRSGSGWSGGRSGWGNGRSSGMGGGRSGGARSGGGGGGGRSGGSRGGARQR
jgi:hypothetical protein